MYHFFLTRGLIRETAHWNEFPHLLTKIFNGSHISLLEIPGAGSKRNMTAPMKVIQMMENMRMDYLEESKQKKLPKVLVAISLGGMIALEWMKKYPYDFQYAVLINTSYSGYSPLWHRLRLTALPAVIKAGLTPNNQRKEEIILNLVANHPEARTKYLPIWTQVQNDRPMKLSNKLRQLIAGATFKARREKPKPKILILTCEKDRMVNYQCSLAIQKAWQCAIEIHLTAGHDLVTDDPEWVATHIKDYLNSDQLIE